MKTPKNTTYYVRWPGTPDEDLELEHNHLCVVTYHKRTGAKDSYVWFEHVVHPCTGFVILGEVIKQRRLDILEAAEVISSTGKKYTVESFLKAIKNNKVTQLKLTSTN